VRTCFPVSESIIQFLFAVIRCNNLRGCCTITVVTADPYRTRNVFARVVGGGSQSRATLDVSHCNFRVGHKSAGLILDCTYDAAGIFLCELRPDNARAMTNTNMREFIELDMRSSRG
jgi:hypothetical protein